jgi:two-component system, NtrC family, response regulator AtoC
MNIRIAVVDDERIVGSRLKNALEKTEEGSCDCAYVVEAFTAVEPFFQQLASKGFHLVFTDLKMPDADGMTVLERIKILSPDTEVIIITGYSSIDSAVEAIKKGAYHYSVKPLKLDQIRLLAKNAVEKIRLLSENRSLRDAIAQRDSITSIVGASTAMQEVFALTRKVAAVDCNVLIQGRSGTGKELVARAIHALSHRKDSLFVSFNCGGFTEELISSELFGHEKGAFTGASTAQIGLIESGAGGTVFLDEIGEMPHSMQVKLLHVIQEKRIFRVGGIRPIDLDIRIVAATNRDLKKEVEAGNFREDLFYRLNVVNIQLPTLAERRDDIPFLISHFVDSFNKVFGKKVRGLSPQALEILMHYDFPGNIRELKNIIERAIALTDQSRIQVIDLPPDLQNLDFKTFETLEMETLEEMEKRYITTILQRTNYNRHLTAKILGLPRTTLWRRLKEYGLDPESGDYLIS